MATRMTSILLGKGLQNCVLRSAGPGPAFKFRGVSFTVMREVFREQQRCLSTTKALSLKEITMKEDGDKIVVEGKDVTSPREKYVAKLSSNPGECRECSLCKLGLVVRHTDVLIISQFMNSKGKQLPREVTGLCREQLRRMDYLIVMAEKAGLIDREVERTVIHNGVVLYTPEEWEEPNYHKWYDESVIEEFLYSPRKRH